MVRIKRPLNIPICICFIFPKIPGLSWKILCLKEFVKLSLTLGVWAILELISVKIEEERGLFGLSGVGLRWKRRRGVCKRKSRLESMGLV